MGLPLILISSNGLSIQENDLYLFIYPFMNMGQLSRYRAQPSLRIGRDRKIGFETEKGRMRKKKKSNFATAYSSSPPPLHYVVNETVPTTTTGTEWCRLQRERERERERTWGLKFELKRWGWPSEIVSLGITESRFLNSKVNTDAQVSLIVGKGTDVEEKKTQIILK